MSRHSIALLRRLFFRRFFDNDLLSPNGGGYENLGLVLAGLSVPGFLAAALLLWKYMNRYVTPGHRLLIALDDKFVCLALSAIVMGIVTLVEWDALALDARDTAILGPLPIARRTLLTAKLGALAWFMVVFAAAVNAIPSVLYPLILFGTLQISLARGVWLMAVHAAVSLAAAAFAFFAVLTIREGMRMLAGPRLFRRVSVVVQSGLIAGLVTALLLSPGHANVSRSLIPGGGAAVYACPPMWFLGLYESLAGRVVLDAPGVEAPRGALLWSPDAAKQARTDYLRHMPMFDRLGGIGVGALASAAILAIGGYAFETRRLARPASRSQSSRPRWLARLVSSIVGRMVNRDPIAHAMFSFTLQTLARGARQRLYLAGFSALAVAAIAAIVPVGEWGRVLRGTSEPDATLLSVQMVVVFCLAAGLRAAFAVPAELPANWTFQVSWTRQPGRYFSGVRRAAFLVTMAPVLVLMPVHAILWGLPIALVHLLVGTLSAAVLIEGALLGLRELPFARAYGSTGTLKVVWPLYVGAFLLSTVGVATIEKWALEGASCAAWLVGLLGTAEVALALVRARRTRRLTDVEFEAPDDRATQRLGISPVG